eukprot:403376694
MFLRRYPKITAFAAIYILILLYAKLRQKTKLQLYFMQNSELAKKVLSKSHLNSMHFIPSFFLPSCHQQTAMNPLMGNVLKYRNPINFKREIFDFHDGGHTAIDWVDHIPIDLRQIICEQNESKTQNMFDRTPIVIVLPGLSSNNNEVYVLNLLIEAKKHGFQAVSPKLYCAASTDDLREPLNYIYKKYCCDKSGQRFRNLYVIGSSMGANIVANYLGEEAEIQEQSQMNFGMNSFQPKQKYDLKVSGACCVQPPMRMWETGSSIQKSFFGMYDKVIGANLKKKVSQYADILHNEYFTNHKVDFKESLKVIRTVSDYDHHVTSKVFGYETRENYYDKASSVHRIPKISVPTFILMAKDDPIIGEKTIDYEICQKNKNIILGVTEYGGHLGYFEHVYSTQQWFVRPVFEFLNSIKE